jgi:IPT/TIG domain
MGPDDVDCIFDGLDLAEDAMLKWVRVMCDARHVEDVESVLGEFGKLIDVLRHLIGAGLAARKGDTETANLEATAALDDLQHFSDHPGQAPQSSALVLTSDPRHIPREDRRRRKHLWVSIRTSIESEAARLARQHGLRTDRRRVDRHSSGTPKDLDEKSPSWNGLLTWFYFSLHLSAAVEGAVTGNRREAKKELGEAEGLAVDSLGGEPLETIECTRRLCDRLSRPPTPPVSFRRALKLGLTGLGLIALALGIASVAGAFGSRKTQSITFTSLAPTNATVGGPTYTPSATASSGLPVTLSIDPSATSVCQKSGGAVSFSAPGTCVIDANQPGNRRYAAAPQVVQSLTVKQRGSVPPQTQSITFTSLAPTNATVGGPTYTPSATASSGLPVTLSIDSSATSVCQKSGGAVSFSAPGTCVIDANQPGNRRYAAAPQVVQSLTAAPSVTALSPTSGPIYGGTQVTVTGTGFTGVTAVMFGSAPGKQLTVESDTELTIFSPEVTMEEPVDITVTASDVTSATSSLDRFSYFVPLT